MAATLSPVEIMHRMSEMWRNGATAAERGELLQVLLRNDRAPRSLLQMLEEGKYAAEKLVDMPQNKIPRAILRAAGKPRKQAQFTQLLQFLHKSRRPASPGDLRKIFGITMQAAKQAGLPAASLDALRRLGAAEVFKAGPTNVARVYDIATRESGARRLWRWATKGDPVLGGKRALGTGPIQNLAADVRAQVDELEGMAKETMKEKVGAAKGVFGKTKAAVGGVGRKAGEVLSPKGLTEAETGTLGKLTKAGAKGLGRGARLARGMGGGAALAVPYLAYEAYDSLVGKSKRARAAMEASRTGGTASPSMELMYDILDKRADLAARRAMLGRDPKLTQQIVQALAGPQNKILTSREVGTGIDRGRQGPSPGEMDALLNQLLGEMRGM
jgi:hypothetical protein